MARALVRMRAMDTTRITPNTSHARAGSVVSKAKKQPLI